MKHHILIHPHLPNGFKAQALSFPHITCVAETEEQAIKQLSAELTEWLSQSRIVTVDVPVAMNTNPLSELAGHAADDPEHQSYLEEIERFRIGAEEPE